MKSLHSYRKAMNDRMAKRLAVSPAPRFLTLQAKQLSASDLNRLPVLPLDPIQNADGSFASMLGFDSLPMSL